MITTFNVSFVSGVSGKYIQTQIEQDGSGTYVTGLYPLASQTQVEPVAKVERQVTYVTENDPFDGYNSGGMTYTTKYIVFVRTSGQPPLRLDMGTVDNQATWLNSLAGMNACVAAIQAQLP